jgi:signal transduction histidine kinase/DNA-binding NarL/FixJ family response regulator/ligand-binding sensor domain-containing protein
MRLLAFLSVIFILVTGANAGEMHFRLKRLTLADGLSHTDVLDVKQDSLGFIWLATFNGLNRYDGYKFQQFYNFDSNRPAVCNRISNLAFEGSVLWMATDGGITKFDIKSECFLPFPASTNNDNYAQLMGSSFKRIYVDSKKLKWALSDKTILVIDDARPEKPTYTNVSDFTNTPDDIGNYNYQDLIEDGFGNVWIATDNGLLQFARRENSFEFVGKFYNYVKGKPGWKNYIADLIINDNGQLIFSNSVSILIHNLRFEPDGTTSIELSEEIPMESTVFKNGKRFDYSYISSINHNKETGYWFFSNGFIHHAKNIEQLHNPTVLYNSTNTHEDYNLNTLTVTSLFPDKKGALFVGTYENNFYIIDLLQKPFNWISSKTVGSSYFPPGRALRSIYEDYDGLLWISSTNGVAVYNKQNGNMETFYHTKDVANIPQKNIYFITGKDKDNIWIGTNEGLEIYNKRTKTTTKFSNEYLTARGFNANIISHIAFDKYRRAWLGSPTGGMAMVDIKGTTITELKTINDRGNFKLLSNKINYIFSDTAKNEVIASSDKGFARIILDNRGNIRQVIKYISHKHSGSPLTSDMIFPIDKLNDSTYYMGTLGGGLNKVVIRGDTTDSLGFGAYSSTAYGIESGLLSQDVEGLIIDNLQRVWCAGNTLSVFDPVSTRFTNYNQNDGIQVEAFKVNTFCKGNDNTFYFGGVDGLTFFDPNQIKPNRIEPTISITELMINDKEVRPSKSDSPLGKNGISFTKHLKLDYLQNDFSIFFSAMHYANPSNCRYRYKLTGFDKDWRNTNSGENSAQYSNLPYGTYTFEVYGTNNDGLWSSTPASLQITVNPPWYQSRLAMIVYALLIIAFFIFIYYNQHRLYLIRQKLKLSEIEEAKKEELLNSKLQFFTNISHEFRTPLTFIISPLLELKNKTKDAELSQSLELALKYANRLLRLIDQLIKFRKSESGTEKVSLSFININEFVKGITNSFEKPALENNITLRVELCNEPLHQWTDATKLEAILYNLLSNAFKSVKEQRNVSVKIISSENANLPVDNRKNQYKIASEKFDKAAFGILISDTGIGISKESLPSIFSRFYNINAENHIGYGIGLALLKNYVLLLNGSIQIASQRDVGTDFLICFPENLPQSESEIENNILFKNNNTQIDAIELSSEIEIVHDSKFLADSGSRKTVLIVEDNHELRNYLYTKLSKNYTVIEASNGIEGIEKAEQESPDLIVSDVMMPQMDGITMCQHLKKEFSTCHIPVLLLTAKSEIDDRIKGLLYGADDYIPKPFSMDYLIVKIQTTLLNREKVILKYSNDAVLNIRSIVTEKSHAGLIEKIIDIVKERMAEPNFGLSTIYGELGMSRSVFFAKIKEATQQTPADFVKHIRLKYGLQYLINNEGRINEAAMHIGMSPSNFTREFKRVFKKTPSDFLSDNKN